MTKMLKSGNNYYFFICKNKKSGKIHFIAWQFLFRDANLAAFYQKKYVWQEH